MSVSFETGFPAGNRANTSGRSRAEVLATVLGIVGAALACFALVLDSFAGKPGFGATQWTMISAGGALVLGATAARYHARRALREELCFVAVLAQAALLLAVVRIYEIENPVFRDLLFAFVVTGFVAQHFAPQSQRLWVFVCVSIVGMLAALGLVNGLLLLAIGLTLIGICHLPLPMVYRVALLLVVALGLASARSGWIEIGRFEAILPILGSIFMFRLMVYLYDMRIGKVPAALAARLSYFFMLPNFAFPFFPVIDQSVWQRSYQPEPSPEVRQRGLVWIQIGIAHLLLYRFVNYRVAFDPAEVAGFWTFLYYCFANFGLYLKISGLFHLILGCLYLLGFALPETHSRYYLSFSFVEFWRRINIYWKDFMQKMVFNPVFTWAKRLGFRHLHAIVIAVAAVFFWTWLLHAYQWFWLRGTLLFSAPDILFWMVLGVLLVSQTVRESLPPRQGGRSLIGPAALMTLRTVATMTTLVVLWSMWSSESMSEWLLLLGRSGLPLLDPVAKGTLAEFAQSALFVAFLLAIAAVSVGCTFGLANGPQTSGGRTLSGRRTGYAFSRHAMATTGFCLALLAVQVPAVKEALPIAARSLAVDMSASRLSSRDQAKLERGYYEHLTDARIVNSDLWNMQPAVQESDIFDQSELVNQQQSYLSYVLKPDVAGHLQGGTFTTNAFGMRDRDYPMVKPPGTTRFALVGDSRAMGMGVDDDQTFENLIEDSLNARFGGGTEVLNFGVAGYDVMQKTLSLDRVMADFRPEVVLYIAHDADLDMRMQFGKLVSRGLLPGDFVNSVIESAGVKPGMSPEAILDIMNDRLPEIAEASYTAFVRKARDGGALPVWIYLPSTKRLPEPLAEGLLLRDLAREVGFVVIDLYDLYNGVEGEMSRLWIAPADDHPNAEAHRLIARRLEAELLAIPEIMTLLSER